MQTVSNGSELSESRICQPAQSSLQRPFGRCGYSSAQLFNIQFSDSCQGLPKPTRALDPTRPPLQHTQNKGSKQIPSTWSLCWGTSFQCHSRKESLGDALWWNPEVQELPAEDEPCLRLWQLVRQWASRKLIFLSFTLSRAVWGGGCPLSWWSWLGYRKKSMSRDGRNI